jgi:plastocyanin
MRAVVLALLVAAVAAGRAGAEGRPGALTGKVTTKGAAEVWVYIEDLPAPLPPEGARPVARMLQQGKAFTPRVLVVTRGTRVEFPNSDPIFHNVFSVTSGATFDLGSYPRGESRGVTLVRAGQVNVFCNIHPQMIGTILVVPGPHHARVAADGTFRLGGLPPGRHRVTAWAPEARPVTREVEVPEGGVATVELALTAGARRPHLRKDGTPYGSYGE